MGKGLTAGGHVIRRILFGVNAQLLGSGGTAGQNEHGSEKSEFPFHEDAPFSVQNLGVHYGIQPVFNEAARIVLLYNGAPLCFKDL
jgi:hypothetical protein|tara:strand:+ start:178 stop:435 length:258 start_codon:yes stop_codon:yes gene_type:complete